MHLEVLLFLIEPYFLEFEPRLHTVVHATSNTLRQLLPTLDALRCYIHRLGFDIFGGNKMMLQHLDTFQTT